MDYETQVLQSGVLQLCNRTALVIDETSMDEGQLKEMGWFHTHTHTLSLCSL